MFASIPAVNRAIVACERCPRLRAYCRRVAREKKREFRDWDYWGKPVPGFGDPDARLLVVGLAPAAHGANRTGRMRSEEHTSELQSRQYLVCRLLLEKKKQHPIHSRPARARHCGHIRQQAPVEAPQTHT